ncbi:MAG: hypothetical protein RL264_1504 [Bacteroidota bacterium]|jgi:hypothetical protein
MKIQQFIKSLNNTELGKSGTNETYVLVSKNVKGIETLFDSQNRKPSLINLKNGGVLSTVHITEGGEFRINGLGDFYRANNANAGDEIIFERRGDQFFVNLLTKTNTIIFQKNSKGFEVLNIDRLKGSSFYNVHYNGQLGKLEIDFKISDKKRSDSPSNTDFYTLKFNNTDLLNSIKSNEYFELTILSNKTELKKVLVWQFYEYKTQ